MPNAYIGLGSNLGEPVAQLSAALEAMARMPETGLVARSSLYRSAPIGEPAQPDFVNAVARVETALAPEALLEALQHIERAHGRARPFPGAPRTLDLDLLLYADQHIHSTTLTVPHPRLHERAFVVRPLAEIAPERLVPGFGRARDLLLRVAGQRADKLPR